MQRYPSVVRTRSRRRRPSFLRRAAGALVLLVGLLALSVVTIGIMQLPGSPVAQTVLRGRGSGDVLAAVPDDNATLAAMRQAIAASGGRASVAIIDLRGQPARNLSLDADASFTAASTYKLPALMATAERVAAGTWRPTDQLCFSSDQQEEGWFNDYQPGDCFARQDLAERVGHYSDNTSAHMLVDELGGGEAINAYARSRGATESTFYDPNRTTVRDLAALLATEAEGKAGGAAAQQWLYPVLTHTAYEAGLPAGVGPQATVIHKIGAVDDTVNDVGLVTTPSTTYVVAVTTDGLGGDAGWALVARLSALAWRFETS